MQDFTYLDEDASSWIRRRLEEGGVPVDDPRTVAEAAGVFRRLSASFQADGQGNFQAGDQASSRAGDQASSWVGDQADSPAGGLAGSQSGGQAGPGSDAAGR